MATTHTHATRVGSRRVVADVAVQLLGQGLNLVLGIVTTVVIVRALGATRYGEWATVLAAIEHSRWNMTHAAAQLGISRNTLYRRIKQLGIPLPHARRS